MTPEHRVMSEVRLRFGEAGWLCFRCNVGTWLGADGQYHSTGLPVGFPDLLAVGPNGRVAFVECKAGRGRQRKEQADFQRAVEALGHTYVLAYSATDIEPLLK